MRIERSHPAAQFTVIPNAALRDDRLSYVARGVLAELLSRPDDWHTTADEIAARARRERGRNGEGRRTIRAAFAELTAARYLHRLRTRDQLGRWKTELILLDRPLADIPDGGTSVPPAQTQVSPGRTDIPPTERRPPGTPATGTPENGTSLRRPATKTETETDEAKTDDETPGVPVVDSSVEGKPANGQVHSFDFFTRHGTEAARQVLSDALTEWERQHPEAAP